MMKILCKFTHYFALSTLICQVFLWQMLPKFAQKSPQQSLPLLKNNIKYPHLLHLVCPMTHRTFDPFFRRLLIVLFWCVFLYALYLMRTVIFPFVTAFILAYVLNPLVTHLSRHIHRLLAIVAVYVALILIFGAMLVWVIPVLWGQMILAWESLPLLVEWYNNTARTWISQHMGGRPVPLELDVISTTLIDYVQKNYQVADAQSFIKKALSSGMMMANNIGLLVMVPILTFYFLIGWHERLNHWLLAIPKDLQDKALQIAKDCDKALMNFIKGQLSVMILLGAIYAIQLQMIGLRFGLLIGIGAGVASFVPYLGFGLGVVVALLVGVFQFGFDPIYLGLIVGAFMIGQVMEGYVLQPLLLGDKIGLSPLWVIFSVLAGASLFGFVGMLIALPVSAVINVLFHHAYRAYHQSQWYQG